MGSVTDLLHVLWSLSSPGEVLLRSGLKAKCWQRFLFGDSEVAERKEHAGSTVRLGAKLVSQSRNCERIVELIAPVDTSGLLGVSGAKRFGKE